jgi:hypothetical protein
MLQADLILAKDFCSHYNITLSFINSLQEYGLIQVVSIEETSYIPEEQLQKLEQLIRLHYDLDINLEGIEAITYLLERVKNLQSEITDLKNKLSLYDNV